MKQSTFVSYATTLEYKNEPHQKILVGNDLYISDIIVFLQQ